MTRSISVLALALALGCGGSPTPELDTSLQELGDHSRGGAAQAERRRGHRRNPVHTASSTSSTVSGHGISYHSGPIMTGTVNVYYIWYGSWSSNTAVGILADLASNIGGTSWYNINTTYASSSGTAVSNAVKYAGSTTDAYSQGTSLTESTIYKVVSSAITDGRLPSDANGVYFVLTSADVDAASFCDQYCGWHTYRTLNGVNIKYVLVGNADRCISICGEQSSSSPNDNPGADAMASVIAHELSETVTDPEQSAWYDSEGEENADKCAWTFGTEFLAANGSRANVFIGDRPFLLQRNWVNSGSGYCALSYGVSPPKNQTVAIKAYVNGKYVTAPPSDPRLIANRQSAGSWEKFYVADQGSGFYSLVANSNSRYVCAENGGASPLAAARTSVGSWEKFKWVDLDSNHFALQANANSSYVCADGAGNVPLIANRTSISSWEIFKWEAQ